MFSQWRGRLYTNLFTTAHFILVGTRLIDDWLRESSIGSTKDLRLNRYLVEMPMRQPLTMTHFLMAVKDVCTCILMRSQPTTYHGDSQP